MAELLHPEGRNCRLIATRVRDLPKSRDEAPWTSAGSNRTSETLSECVWETARVVSEIHDLEQEILEESQAEDGAGDPDGNPLALDPEVLRTIRLLVVDDEPSILASCETVLSDEGYDVQLERRAEEALRRVRSQEFDIVLIDQNMPNVHGLDILAEVRKRNPDTLAIVMTGHATAESSVRAMQAGAWDYLPKPFNPGELAARIRAILRRAEAPPERSEMLIVDDLVVHLGSRAVRVGDAELALTGVEFSLLDTLVHSAGKVVSRDELSQAALFRKANPFDRSLDVHISNLRRKLGPAPGGGERIKTVRGVGYQYVRSTGPG